MAGPVANNKAKRGAGGRLASLKDFTGWILMAVALLLGLVAFLMIRGYLNNQEEQLKKELLGKRPDVVRVVVATQSLDAGDVITKRNVALGRLPRAHVSPRMVRANEFDQINFRVLSRPMTPGEPLLQDFLAGVVAERFSDLLKPGERAVSLEAKSLDNISGMLLPGDYIDLYSVIKTKGRNVSARIIPVLERVKVLAAGEQPLRNAEQEFQPLSERDVEDYRQLTVGLSMADAERLIVAKETSKIVFLLRNADDDLPGSLANAASFEQVLQPGYLYLSNDNMQGVWRPVNSVDVAPPDTDRALLSAQVSDLADFDAENIRDVRNQPEARESIAGAQQLKSRVGIDPTEQAGEKNKVTTKDQSVDAVQ